MVQVCLQGRLDCQLLSPVLQVRLAVICCNMIWISASNGTPVACAACYPGPAFIKACSLTSTLQALDALLDQLGLLPHGATLPETYPLVEKQFKIMWADHGDALSTQYAGGYGPAYSTIWPQPYAIREEFEKSITFLVQ